ncbi:MAG: NAD(P)/FAD-dependent oxidoreductase [Actinomycetota bacterium]
MTEHEHVDVLVVGAGISGIGAAYHLQTMCPDRSFAILEGRDSIGGTWDLFRYPGIRSDSDMHTLGFSFKPWTKAKSIADGPSIMEYLHETVAEHGIDQHIRFNHLVTAASWSTDDARWTVTATRRDPGSGATEQVEFTCGFLYLCAGYYSYKGGFTPDFPGRSEFQGTVIHPQQWPEDLDYTDKKVVVIGSGATAMTLLPAMAPDVAHITMLQRSPTYVVARPSQDVVANRLRSVLPDSVAYRLTRWKNVKLGNMFYRKTRRDPDKVRELLLGGVRQGLGEDYDIDTHFTPTYNPWDQRLCLLPDGDLFKAIRSGKASVVTDTIERFTETGVALSSGEHLDADIVVTATGLQLVTVGEIDVAVDGDEVDFSSTWTYKGMGYSDVPNLISTFGYINASWTLRADLIADYVCRLLNHMRTTGTEIATPRLRPSDADMVARPWIDDFSSGYMQRVMDRMPQQSDQEPWINCQDILRERKLIGKAPVDDGVMTFTRARTRASVG